jgi:spore germination protein
MSRFNYDDEKIRSKDIAIALPSMLIAVGVLSLPGRLAQTTNYADGWVTLLVAGAIVVGMAWAIAKLASKFPQESFLSYTSKLVSKPIAHLFIILFVLQGLMVTAYEIRRITDISLEYLFDRTPLVIVALTFLLVVVYAVSGSRVAIFRLNAMFIPIIFFMTFLLALVSLPFMEMDLMLPVFTTDLRGYVDGIRVSALSFTGFSILFFYMALVKDPEKAPKKSAFGMVSAVVLYLVLFIVCIAVFGEATKVIRLPVIELAKSIEIPGGFLDRIESLFFVIWITAIFTTTMMSFDVAVYALSSIFTKVRKELLVFLLAPLVLFLSLLPTDYLEMTRWGEIISYISWGGTVGLLILLWVMYGIRGGNRSEK